MDLLKKTAVTAVFMLFFLSSALADSITKTGSWPFGWSYAVCVSNGNVFMASGCGVFILDSSAGTVISDAIRTNDLAVSLAVSASGQYLYVGTLNLQDGTTGVFIYDVSNPASPVLQGSYAPPAGTQFSITVSGNYMYLSCYTDGLLIVDVSNPAAPVLAATYPTTGNTWSTFVSGATAYICQEDSMDIVDVTTPSSPAYISTYSDPGNNLYPVAVYVNGNYAYIAGYYAYEVVDISNPAAAVMAGLVPGLSAAWNITQSGTTSFLSTATPFQGTGGLIIMDASNPAAPVSAATTSIPDSAYDAARVGQHGLCRQRRIGHLCCGCHHTRRAGRCNKMAVIQL